MEFNIWYICLKQAEEDSSVAEKEFVTASKQFYEREGAIEIPIGAETPKTRPHFPGLKSGSHPRRSLSLSRGSLGLNSPDKFRQSAKSQRSAKTTASTSSANEKQLKADAKGLPALDRSRTTHY